MKIHVLHENEAWTEPLFRELSARELPYENWHLDAGRIDPQAPPPTGIFYNRMSASSHTRDHRFAPELTSQVLRWLETFDRRVINGTGALRLEIDKLAQYATLESYGIQTPRTIGATGREQVIQAARDLRQLPFILKPNRGGAGAGVQLIETIAQLAALLDDPAKEQPLDGLWLVQKYVRASEPAITRCEFIGGQFLYAVRVNTSQGFELCPADACDLPDGLERFEILLNFDDPVFAKYSACLAANGIEVAAIEFIRDAEGEVYSYDINTNTNYNSRAEAKMNVSGMGALADFLGQELLKVRDA
jgi:RimK-like ATP-grasp domain